MNKISPLKNSVFSKASLVFGVVCVITFSIAAKMASFFLSCTDESLMEGLGIFMLVLIIPALIGFVLGLCGIMQRNKKKEFACIGLALNGGALMMIFFYFFMAIFMANGDTLFL